MADRGYNWPTDTDSQVAPVASFFQVGDRVTMRYGKATVTNIFEDESGAGREPLLFVHADIGQGWLVTLDEAERIEE